MRKPYEPQQRLDLPRIVEVDLNFNCRHELVPILKALQYIYSQPQLRDSILDAIGEDVNGASDARRGRRGLYYWEILVLAAVRLGCNLDYDALQDLAENHRALRQVMGIGDWEDRRTFDWRRIQDNLTKIRPETLERINELVVAAGHKLVSDAAEAVRADAFVAETNIHYPTESSLIRDGLRKVLGLCGAIAGVLGLAGWRQQKHLERKVRKLAGKIDRLARQKGSGSQPAIVRKYRELLALAETVLSRAVGVREAMARQAKGDLELEAMDRELEIFMERTRQVCDTARRRVLEGEAVPNREKLFSIFEPHTQLYKRGKVADPVQFGRLVLVWEDSVGFVVRYSILPREAHERDVVVAETAELQRRLGGKMKRLSLDRGFHSPENQKALAEILEHPCLPALGCKQAAEQERESTVEFRESRQRHPGIESAIHALQSGNGLERCRDRTERGFARYIGLGVLGRNLHVLGKHLIAQEARGSPAAFSRRAA